jgi:hypothetical protein
MVKIAEVRLGQFVYFVKIRDMGHADGAVDGAYRGGHDRGFYAPPASLDASGIGASGDEGFVLPPYALFAGYEAEPGKEFPVIDGGVVHKGEDYAQTGSAGPAAFRNAGQVGGGGSFEDYGNVGGGGEGGAYAAPEADFFLNGKDKPCVGLRPFFEHFQHDRAADTVVYGLGFDKVIAEFDKIAFKSAYVAYGYQFFRFFPAPRAYVYIELVKLGDLGFFFLAYQMPGLDRYDARNFPVSDPEPFAQDYPGVDVSQIGKFKKTVIAYVFDDKTDFVHVGAEHNFFAYAFFALPEHQDIA